MKNKYAELLANINNDPKDKHSSVLIIDGLNTFLRSFTMINHINPSGHHIGGLTGFLKSVGYAIKILNPTRVIITFDGVGGSSGRKNLFPDYKANRNTSRMTNYSIFNSKDEEVESISHQMERLIAYLHCLPVTLICVDAIEADDVIAKLTQQYEQDEKDPCGRKYFHHWTGNFFRPAFQCHNLEQCVKAGGERTKAFGEIRSKHIGGNHSRYIKNYQYQTKYRSQSRQ